MTEDLEKELYFYKVEYQALKTVIDAALTNLKQITLLENANLDGHIDALRTRLEAVEKANGELVKDKERLDWLENESIILNKLFGSPDAVKTFYHIFRKGKHFGGCETALLNLRQTIDKATAEAMKGELKTTHTVYEANNGDD